MCNHHSHETEETDESRFLSRRQFVALGASAAVFGTSEIVRAAEPSSPLGAKPLAPASASVTTVAAPTSAKMMAPMPNRAPLQTVPFVALPLGSVRARGWLLRQLELQRDGLTGHAEEILPATKSDSAWLGGKGEDWEKGPYYVKGLLSLAYTLDDADLKNRAQKWVEGILSSQRADGFFGPTTNDDWWPRMVATHIVRDYGEATGDARVVPFLTKYYRYMNENLSKRPLRDWGRARSGDELDTVFWLYNRTGDSFLMNVADLLHEQAYPWRDIFTRNRFMHFGEDFHPKHNVNVPQAMKLPPLYWQRSNDAGDRAAFKIGEMHLNRDHGTAVGINTGTEFLSGRSSTQGIETCSTVERMLSDEIALRILGDASIGDNLEFMAFNALPAALSNGIRQHVYYTLPNNVSAPRSHLGFTQDYDDARTPSPRSGFPCCCYNFHMGWPKFAQNCWAATSNGGLAVLAYAPSQVTHTLPDGAQIGFVQETDYPFSDTIRFRYTGAQASRFSLQLRIPAWCDGAQIQINGKKGPRAEANRFVSLERQWQPNDEVLLRLPMQIRLESGVNDSQSVWRGPLLYTLKIEEEWKPFTTPNREGGPGFESFEVLPTSAWNYALQLGKAPQSAFKFQSKPLSGDPFDKNFTPVALQAQAKKLPEWTLSPNNAVALDPPLSPVSSSAPTETVTLVPFGAQMLRVSNFPVLGNPLRFAREFRDDFSNGFVNWVTYGGGWLVREGAFGPSPDAPRSFAVANKTQFDNLIYEADITLAPEGDAGLMFRVSNPTLGADNYRGYYVGFLAAGNSVVLGKSNNKWTEIERVEKILPSNTPIRVRVEARGPNIRVFVGDMTKAVLEARDEQFKRGMIGVRQYDARGNQPQAQFAKIVAIMV